MTIGDIRAFARLACEWCLAQDDLQGFCVWIWGPPDRPVVQVVLDWPNHWRSCQNFPAEDMRGMDLDQQWLNSRLEVLAVEARKRAARIADPNRLPG